MLLNSPKKLNVRQMQYCDEVKAILLEGRPFTFEEFSKFKDKYSGNVRVEFECEDCGAFCSTPFKKLKRRKYAQRPTCPSCSVKEVTSLEEWKKNNSEAQLKVQSTPEVLEKNRQAVKKFWANNPEIKEKMRSNLLKAHQREDVRERMRNRTKHSGTGISGLYQSKWGEIRFDSCYELGFIVEMEKRNDVVNLSRGPAIDYTYEDKVHQYIIDFRVEFQQEIILAEIKGSYISNVRDLRIKAKNDAVEAALKGGIADRFIFVTEKDCKEQFGFNLPTRKHDRHNLFKSLEGKVQLHQTKYEEMFYGKAS